MHERLLARWRPSPFELKIGLRPGHYTVRAQTEKGHRGQLEFEVTDASAEPHTIRVNMR